MNRRDFGVEWRGPSADFCSTRLNMPITTRPFEVVLVTTKEQNVGAAPSKATSNAFIESFKAAYISPLLHFLQFSIPCLVS